MRKVEEHMLEHVGESLITVKGTNECLGYLMHFKEHGTFCPRNGLVPVSKEAADIHNAALSAAEVEGLDKNCEIGQGGTFYFVKGRVQTWGGMVICVTPHVTGRIRKTVHFTRNGKKFKGILHRNDDCFFLRRIA